MKQRRPDVLTASLRELDEPRASEGFTERVLEGLDRRIRRRARLRAAGMAAASIALVTLMTLVAVRRPQAPQGAQAQADDIRREYSQLVEELEELRRSRELAPTVLYLGGDNDYDIVLDLNPLLDEMMRPAATPAAYSPRSQPLAASQEPRRRP